MKIKLLIALVLLTLTNTHSMEQPAAKRPKLKYNTSIEDIVIEPISEVFADAWALVTKQQALSLKGLAALRILRNKITISENQLPEDLP